jgi:hypothetical protein
MSITPQEGLNYFKNTQLNYLVDNHPMNESNIKKDEENAVVFLVLFELL